MKTKENFYSENSKPSRATKVAAVIPIHNGMPHLPKCLQALKRAQKPDIELSVFLVDAQSTDESVSAAYNIFPELHVVSVDQSVWWTGAINEGTRAAVESGVDFILWMNPDDEAEPDAIQNLLEAAKASEKSIHVCGVIHSKRPQWVEFGSIMRIAFFRLPHPVAIPAASLPESKGLIPIDVSGGHGALIPSSLFQRGRRLLRPELLPHYYGDHSFYLNAKNYGCRAYGVPNAIVRNETASDSFQNGYCFRDLRKWKTFLFSRRSAGNLRDRPLLALFHFPIPFNILWAIYYVIRSLGAIVRAVLWNLPVQRDLEAKLNDQS